MGKLIKTEGSNSDTEDLIYLKDSILPIIRMYEQMFTAKCLNTVELDEEMEIKFSMNGFARATMEKRGNFYQQMLRSGVFSPNQILQLEDMQPYEGGDVHLISRDLIPLDKLDKLLEVSSTSTSL